jgi:outer membrane protein insertion porin family
MRALILCTQLMVCVGLMVGQGIAQKKPVLLVHGLHHISKKTLVHYWGDMPEKRLGVWSQVQLNKAVHQVYDVGFFSDVWVNQTTKGQLVLAVKERAIVHAMHYGDYDQLPQKKLKAWLTKFHLTVGSFYHPAQAQALQAVIRKFYDDLGYFHVKVHIAVKHQAGNKVALQLELQEGDVASLKKIEIIGAHHFSKAQLMKRWPISEHSFFSFLTGSDHYVRANIAQAVTLLEQFYKQHGYLNYRLQKQQELFDHKGNNVKLILTIHEGQQYTISACTVTINKLVAVDQHLRHYCQRLVGHPYQQDKLHQALHRFGEQLKNEKLLHYQYNVQRKLNKRRKTVALVIVKEPVRADYIRYIHFHGHHQISELVLQRALDFQEGGLLNKDAMQHSYRQLMMLGFVDKIDFQPKMVPGTRHLYDFDITVHEKKMLSLQLNLGWGSGEGFLTNISFSHGNFLGLGKRLTAQFKYSQVNQVLSFDYHDPYYQFNGGSRSYGVYFKKHNPGKSHTFNKYVKDSLGAYLNYGYPLTRYLRAHYGFGASRNKLKYFDQASQEVQSFIGRYGALYNEYYVYGGLTYNTLDRTFFATKGQKLSLDTNIRLPLDTHSARYYTIGLDWGWYHPITHFFNDKDNFIFGLEYRLDYGHEYGSYDEYPFYARFSAGGLGSIKGFNYGSIGPKDSLGNVLGGNVSQFAEAQVLLPERLLGENLRVSCFFDVATVEMNRLSFTDMRASTGVMLKWYTPLLPLTLSYAIPVRSEPGDSVRRFDIGVGALF